MGRLIICTGVFCSQSLDPSAEHEERGNGTCQVELHCGRIDCALVHFTLES